MTNRLTIRQQVFYFVVSIVINGIGNGLTVALNLGSALWTASAVNIAHASGLQLNLVMMLIALFAIIVNIFLRGHVSWRAILGNLIFTIPFSVLVGWSANFFRQTSVVNLPLPVRVLLDFVGIAMIGVAISIYQRLNIVLHPTDEMMQLVRFKLLHGKAWAAQLASFMPPLAATLVTFMLTHQIFAINIGTIFSLLCQGFIIGFADRVIFPKLKHQRI